MKKICLRDSNVVVSTLLTSNEQANEYCLHFILVEPHLFKLRFSQIYLTQCSRMPLIVKIETNFLGHFASKSYHKYTKQIMYIIFFLYLHETRERRFNSFVS